MCDNVNEHPIDLNKIENELTYCQRVLLDRYNDKTITSSEFADGLDELESIYMTMKDSLFKMCSVIGEI